MRELTSEEIEMVPGAGIVGEMTADAGAIGMIAGAVKTNTLAGATRGGAYGALVGAAFGVGYGTGTAIAEYYS